VTATLSCARTCVAARRCDAKRLARAIRMACTMLTTVIASETRKPKVLSGPPLAKNAR
jgi:hypothetical protein